MIRLLLLMSLLVVPLTSDAKPVKRRVKTPVYRNPCPISREQRLCGAVSRILRRCTPNHYDPNTGHYHDRCYAY